MYSLKYKTILSKRVIGRNDYFSFLPFLDNGYIVISNNLTIKSIKNFILNTSREFSFKFGFYLIVFIKKKKNVLNLVFHVLSKNKIKLRFQI